MFSSCSSRAFASVCVCVCVWEREREREREREWPPLSFLQLVKSHKSVSCKMAAKLKKRALAEFSHVIQVCLTTAENKTDLIINCIVLQSFWWYHSCQKMYIFQNQDNVAFSVSHEKCPPSLSLSLSLSLYFFRAVCVCVCVLRTWSGLY